MHISAWGTIYLQYNKMPQDAQTHTQKHTHMTNIVFKPSKLKYTA